MACITRAIRASDAHLGSFGSDDTRHCVVVITHMSRTRLYATDLLSPFMKHRISYYASQIVDSRNANRRVRFAFSPLWLYVVTKTVMVKRSASSNDMLIDGGVKRGLG